jgi:hypothetical protein
MENWVDVKTLIKQRCDEFDNDVEKRRVKSEAVDCEERKTMNKATDDVNYKEVYLFRDSYIRYLHAVSRPRRFFITKTDLFGMGPSNSQVGDSVVVIFFGPTP